MVPVIVYWVLLDSPGNSLLAHARYNPSSQATYIDQSIWVLFVSTSGRGYSSRLHWLSIVAYLRSFLYYLDGHSLLLRPLHAPIKARIDQVQSLCMKYGGSIASVLKWVALSIRDSVACWFDWVIGEICWHSNWETESYLLFGISR